MPNKKAKMRQEKQKKKGREKAKRTSEDCHTKILHSAHAQLQKLNKCFASAGSEGHKGFSQKANRKRLD